MRKPNVDLHQKALEIEPSTDVMKAMKFTIDYNLKSVNSKGLNDLSDDGILGLLNTILVNTQEVIKKQWT